MKDMAEAWKSIRHQLEVITEEYAADGWAVQEINPGDVQALDRSRDDRLGLDVLVPDNQYESIEQLIESGIELDNYHVYRSADAGIAYLIVILEDSTEQVVVAYPAFYQLDEKASSMFDEAQVEGAISTYFRTLSGDYIELRHDDPSLFLTDTNPDGD